MPRITLELDEKTYADLKEFVPHGFRAHVLSSLVQLAVTGIRDEGLIMIGALMSGEFKLVRDEQRKD